MLDKKTIDISKNSLPEKYINHNNHEVPVNEYNLLTVGVIGVEGSGKSSVIEAVYHEDFYSTLNKRIVTLNTDDKAVGFSYNALFKKDNDEFLLRFIEEDEKTNAETVVAMSSVILVIIDSPSLMLKGGVSLNYTDTDLNGIFNGNLKEDNLVVFVPVKCAKYMFNNGNALQENMNNLREKIKETYKKTIGTVRGKCAASLILPIDTNSASRFKMFDPETGKAIFEDSGKIIMRTVNKEIYKRSPDKFHLFVKQLILTIIRFRLEMWKEQINDKKLSEKIKKFFNSDFQGKKTEFKNWVDSKSQEKENKNKVHTLLQGNLFKKFFDITRILDDIKWKDVVNKQVLYYGIKPQQSSYGFEILHDQKGYFEDIRKK